MRYFLSILFIVTLSVTNAQSINQNMLKNGRDRIVVGLDWTGWIQNNTDVNQKWYNRGFHVYLMGDRPFNEKLSLGIGGGISFSNIYHNGQIVRDSADVILFNPISDSVEFSTNKFSFIALELPVELKYLGKEDNNGNRWKFAFGGKLSYQISNFYKYKGPGNEFGVNVTESKFKTYDIPGITRIQYGPSFRIGYGPVNLEAYYAIPAMFDQKVAPEMHTFRVGISFNNL